MDPAEARAAYDARSWARAYARYRQAAQLDLADLDRYAESAMLLGLMDEYFAIRERAYEQGLASGDLVGAAQAAFWTGMQRVVAGDVAVGSGWLARAARLVAEDGTDSVPAGYLLVSAAFEAVSAGDGTRADRLLDEAIAAGRRLGAPDLVVLAAHQQGLGALAAGEIERGLTLLDEAMLELTSTAHSPMVTGIVYCSVISGCWSTYELRRAEQWTAAMTGWVQEQPEMVNFTGECKVRRAELTAFRGGWDEARLELAGVDAADVDTWASGCAAYTRGNLDRLEGRYDAAEECYAVAARCGFDPQPGLALLRLARGSVQAALAMVRRSLAERQEDGKRVELLAAAVEVCLAAGETAAADDAVLQLAELADKCRSPVVLALHEQALAELALAAGRPDDALTGARTAWRHWRELRAPYHEGRARALIAAACRALGDLESAATESAAAADLFRALGAAPDLARLHGDAAGPLSPRELEVLRVLATGATNRAIAERLVLSERTVDRHVSNIFTKLGVSTRAAATAYAFERRMV